MGENLRSNNVRNGIENAFRTCFKRRKERDRNNAQDQDQELSGRLDLPSFCLEIQSKKQHSFRNLTRDHATMLMQTIPGETMILTRSEGERLTRMIAAMRPDFDSNGIARILQKANQHEGLPAHNMDHAIRAAAHYTTQQAPDGSYAKHTPAMYPATGQHWDQTAPTGSRHKRHQEPPCEEHPTYDARTCACCWADIKLGQRPETMLGKRIHPTGKPNAFGAEAVKQALRALKSPENDVEASETTRGVAQF